MSQITTHILDTALGRPASGVTIKLYQKQDESWSELASGITNEDGRIANLLPEDAVLAEGIYKMHFQTSQYHQTTQQEVFYPEVDIQFWIRSQEHYHIPLLLNPFGYSTYRGN